MVSSVLTYGSTVRHRKVPGNRMSTQGDRSRLELTLMSRGEEKTVFSVNDGSSLSHLGDCFDDDSSIYCMSRVS